MIVVFILSIVQLPFIDAPILAHEFRCSATILIDFVVGVVPQGFAGAAF